MGFPQRRTPTPALDTAIKSPDVTVSLTGISAAATLGSLAVAAAIALTGLTAAAATVGSVAPSTSVVLTQVAATATAGTLTETHDGTVALTQIAASGSVGNLSPATSVAVSQVVATGTVGTLTPATSRALTAVSAAGSVGSLSPATSVALTSVSGTGSLGTITPAASLGLSQVAGAGSIGTLTPGTARALTAVTATGSLGAITPATSVALTRVAASGSLGILTVAGSPDVTVTLSGVSATASVGTLSPQTSRALTGASATGAVGSLSPGVSHALSQIAATGSVGTLGVARTASLSGVGGIGGLGTLSPSLAASLTGISALGSLGTVTPSGGTLITHSDIILLSASASTPIVLKAASHALISLPASVSTPVQLPATSASLYGQPGYRETVIHDGASVYFPLDDAGPTYVDLVHGIVATAHGGVAAQRAGPLAAVEPVVQFDGVVGTRIFVPRGNAAMNAANQANFSQEAWFRLQPPADQTQFVEQVLWFWNADHDSVARDLKVSWVPADFVNPGDPPFWWMESEWNLSPSGPDTGYISTVDLDTFAPLYQFETGAWHHVVAVVDNVAHAISLYLDGVLFEAAPLSQPYVLNGYNADLIIGNKAIVRPITDASYTSPWVDRIGHMAIYFRALSATEVANQYRLRLVPSTARLIELPASPSTPILLEGSTA